MLSDPRKRLDVTLSQGDFAFVKYRDTASHRLRRSSRHPPRSDSVWRSRGPRPACLTHRTGTGIPHRRDRHERTRRHDSSSGGSGVIRPLAAEGVR